MSSNPYPLLGPSASQQTNDIYRLGVDVNFSSSAFSSVNPTSQVASDFFGVSSGSVLMKNLNAPRPESMIDFFDQQEPKASESIGDLTLDLLAKMTHLDQLKAASDAGKVLYETSEVIKESPYDPVENITCNLVKVAAETVVSGVGTGMLLKGTIVIIEGANAMPPVALVIPVVAAALPQAYNVQALSKFAGKKGENGCHSLFAGE